MRKKKLWVHGQWTHTLSRKDIAAFRSSIKKSIDAKSVQPPEPELSLRAALEATYLSHPKQASVALKIGFEKGRRAALLEVAAEMKSHALAIEHQAQPSGNGQSSPSGIVAIRRLHR